MNELSIKLPKLFDKQKQIKAESKRFNVVCVGRRSGKTILCEDLLIDSILLGKRVAYFAPTYKMLKEVWKDIKNILNPIISKVSEQDKSIEFITKGQIDFWSLDSYDSVRGRKYHRALLDEVAFSPYLEEAWSKAIRPTLIDYLGDAYFFSTPKGQNYFKTLFQNERTQNDWKSWQIPTYDFNPNISKVELESFRESMPSIIFQQEIEAQFIDLQGALVKREWIKYYDRLPDDLEIKIAVDTASEAKKSSDYTAIAVVGYKDKQYYILDIFRDKLTTTNQIASAIQLHCDKWNTQYVTVEKTGQMGLVIRDIQAQLNKVYINTKTPTKDKLTRFLPTIGKYEKLMISHNPNLPKYFEDELLSFTGDKDLHDDMIDALGMAMDSIITTPTTARFI